MRGEHIDTEWVQALKTQHGSTVQWYLGSLVKDKRRGIFGREMQAERHCSSGLP